MGMSHKRVMRSPRWPQSAIRPLEQSGPLSSVGKIVTKTFSRVVRPGRAKDALSGTWMGHPAHPMLTDVPIGAWTSAFLLDLLGGRSSRHASDALVGVGVLAAIPTAVTGLSDLADSEDHEELSVGAAHALGNVVAILVYALAYGLRRRGDRRAGTALSVLGAATVTGSGFLGGHLAYRRGIGVDQTVFSPRLADWTAVIEDDELAENEARLITVAGTDVFFCRRGGDVFALADRCSHRGGPLHKGQLGVDGVVCPWHFSTFGLDDGAIVRGPATAPQPAYEVRSREGWIEVRSRP